MNVQWIFQLFRKGLYLQFLFNQLGLQVVDLLLELWYFLAILHQNLKLSFQVTLFTVEKLQIVHPLSKGSFTLREGSLLDLNFFIEQR